MDPSFQEFQFLDLTDINDVELRHLQNVLYASDPNVKYPELPWVELHDDGEDELSATGDHVSTQNTLDPEVPPYPVSSTHIPVTMYQMMPSVYVNNVTANVSVHPYMHPYAIYPPQEQPPPRNNNAGRRLMKSNSKSREYRNIDSNMDTANAGSPMQPQYPTSYIPMHPYNTYYSTPSPGHIQSAQHATGTPIFLPGHQISMYPPPTLAYPYHPPIYSPVDPTVYNNEVPKDPNQYQPEKIRTYDYSSQNQSDHSNESYSQDVSFNNKEPAITVYHDKGTTHYANHEAVLTHYAGSTVKRVENTNKVSYKKKDSVLVSQNEIQKTENSNVIIVKDESSIVNIVNKNDSPLFVPGEMTFLNDSVLMTDNLTNSKAEIIVASTDVNVKIPGVVKYVGDIIVSELKSDAQVFRPANKTKEKFVDLNSVAINTIIEQKPVEPIQPQVNKVVTAVTLDKEPTLESCTSVVEPAAQPDFGLVDEVPVPAVTPAGKSWASLFNKNSEGDQEIPSKLIARVEPFKSQEENVQDSAQMEAEARRAQRQFDDPQLYRLGELLCKYELDHKAISLQPRGLTNRSNWCYINSTLQALLACPPFYNLMRDLPYPKKNQKSPTPILDSIVQFVNEFVPLSSVSRVNRKERSHRKDDGSMDVQCGPAFEPAYIYKMLNNIRSDTFKVEGRQEDAEEFLSCLLNALNDEMLEVIKMVQDNSPDTDVMNGDEAANHSQDDSDSEWKVMGPKNKGSVTRRSDFGRTPISDIFRGHLRSRVQRAGDQSTDNVQPFFTLQLDIEKAQSVKEALELLVGRDQLEGVTCTKTNQEVEAWQQVTLEDLPLVLVLHLKWFDYKVDGCTKIMKSVEFPIELKVDPKLMSQTKKYGTKAKQYKLFAVVYHDGKEATKGHYVTDVFHVGYGGWVRYDDSTVRAVQEMQVLHPRSPRVPYLLYYRRCDTIGNLTLGR